MSWHDPARTLEPEADAALREEMRSLLGFVPRNYFESEPSAELMLLADDLRREAKRRNHTARKQHSWMLMAAALPLALMVAGVGAWGVTQKHKADSYAAAMQAKEAELQRMAATLKATEGPSAPSRTVASEPLQLASRSTAPKPKLKGKELIIPVERTAEPLANDTQRVKGH